MVPVARTSPRRAGVLAMVLLVGLVAGGCAAIPERTAVREIGTHANKPSVDVPVAPRPDADPPNLVRDFIAASADPSDDHGSAKQYLRPKTAQTWDDAASTLIVEDDFSTVYAPGTTNVDKATAVTVLVRANKLGRINSLDRTYTAEPGDHEFSVRLERDAGRQWRIVELPPGVMISKAGFDSTFQAVRLYFVQPDRSGLIPDLRYLPKGNPTTLPREVVNLLINGPSEALRDTVVSALPSSTRLGNGVTRDANDTLVVDLADMTGVSQQDESLIAAQVVLSLQQVSNGVIKLTRNRFNWLENRASEFSQYTNPNQPSPDTGVMVIGGRMLSMKDGARVQVESAGDDLNVITAALGTEGIRNAVVARSPSGSGQSLYIGRQDRAYKRVDLGSRSISELSRPTWRRGNNELWTVADGDRIHRVTPNETAATGPDGEEDYTVRQVVATELRKHGEITTLRLSRDGVRVAAVAGGQLLIGAVRERAGETQVVNVRVLHPEGLAKETIDVDWLGPDSLIVATDLANHLVMKTSLDGYQTETFPGSNLTRRLRSVAAAPGVPTVVADANGLWTVESPNSVIWQPHRQSPVGNQVIPIYPG